MIVLLLVRGVGRGVGGVRGALGQGHGHRGDDLRVGVVGVEGQRVAAAHLERDALPDGDALEHVDDVLMRVAQHTRVVHEHQHITCSTNIGGCISLARMCSENETFQAGQELWRVAPPPMCNCQQHTNQVGTKVNHPPPRHVIPNRCTTTTPPANKTERSQWPL